MEVGLMTKAADFEKSLKRLEKLVQELEEGNLCLDEALKKYQEGIELSRSCSKMLKDAKAKIERLTKKEGTLVAEELEPEEEIQDVS
jgi:exodeoxyribonuclease VII small subunit